MLFSKLLSVVALAATTRLATGVAIPGPNGMIFDIDGRITDLVTWDNVRSITLCISSWH